MAEVDFGQYCLLHQEGGQIVVSEHSDRTADQIDLR